MLFADIELAARIEAAQGQLMAECTAATARRRPEATTWVERIAGGVATIAGAGSPLNKVVGLGFAGPVDGTELGAAFEPVEQAFARAGLPVQVELSTLADPSILPVLVARGYALTGFEHVLGRPLSSEAPGDAPDDTPGEVWGAIDDDVEIAPCGEDELNVWLDALVTGFVHPDRQGVPSHEEFPREALERVIGDMASTPGFVRYLARRRGEPAGGGGLWISQRQALLCGAATVPAHRRHGIQTALLRARLHEAMRASCDLAVVTVLPGSRSQHNVQRQGFVLLYTRAVLVRESPTSS
ncbi:MAG: GNAT family N-acetyltransferase [Myxococcota bacterium]